MCPSEFIYLRALVRTSSAIWPAAALLLVPYLALFRAAKSGRDVVK